MMLVTVEYTFRAVISVDTKDPGEAEIAATTEAGLVRPTMTTSGNRIIDWEFDPHPDREEIISVIPG
jgi:ribose 5-phosphate isomerase